MKSENDASRRCFHCQKLKCSNRFGALWPSLPTMACAGANTPRSREVYTFTPHESVTTPRLSALQKNRAPRRRARKRLPLAKRSFHSDPCTTLHRRPPRCAPGTGSSNGLRRPLLSFPLGALKNFFSRKLKRGRRTRAVALEITLKEA